MFKGSACERGLNRCPRLLPKERYIYKRTGIQARAAVTAASVGGSTMSAAAGGGGRSFLFSSRSPLSLLHSIKRQRKKESAKVVIVSLSNKRNIMSTDGNGNPYFVHHLRHNGKMAFGWNDDHINACAVEEPSPPAAKNPLAKISGRSLTVSALSSTSSSSQPMPRRASPHRASHSVRF